MPGAPCMYSSPSASRGRGSFHFYESTRYCQEPTLPTLILVDNQTTSISLFCFFCQFLPVLLDHMFPPHFLPECPPGFPRAQWCLAAPVLSSPVCPSPCCAAICSPVWAKMSLSMFYPACRTLRWHRRRPPDAFCGRMAASGAWQSRVPFSTPRSKIF